MMAERRISGLVVALSASVLMNVFLVGLMAGHFVGVGRIAELFGAAPSPQIARPMLDRFRALPLSDRLRFRAVMADHRDQLRLARIALWQARRHAMAVLSA